MFDVGWSELLLIGIVALIVVGPKDLPHLFHSLGRFTAKARSMAREFTSAMEDAAKGSGIDDAASSLRDLKSLTSKKSLGLDALDRAADRFEKWDPARPSAQTGARPDPAAGPIADRAPGTAPAPGAAASPATGAARPAATATSARTGRRLHAVRRSDMKDS